VDDLVRVGIAVESDGALVVFSEDVTGPDGSPVPLMVRKKDGGYSYDTTDLATIRYRINELKADRILYVVDARQALHFRLVFEVARRVGWLTEDIEVAHIAFGTVLGPDGRPFRTRSGETVKLTTLLDAAVDKARAVVAEKNDQLDDAALDQIAEQAGIGAVKYADLSSSRVKDYVFDVDRMVSFTGNTGVYLQYAHTRISSILRKAGDTATDIDPSLPLHRFERVLALVLDGFADALVDVGATLEPHRLCNYLYELARLWPASAVIQSTLLLAMEGFPCVRVPAKSATRMASIRLPFPAAFRRTAQPQPLPSSMPLTSPPCSAAPTRISPTATCTSSTCSSACPTRRVSSSSTSSGGRRPRRRRSPPPRDQRAPARAQAIRPAGVARRCPRPLARCRDSPQSGSRGGYRQVLGPAAAEGRG